ncbi:MAG: ligase-associated DNA damage response endonuclease PdeM [Caulobacteraceae bacterium]
MAGATATLRCSGALWIEAERALVFADLHFEKGSSYAARGQMLPPYDTRETLARVAAEAAAMQPHTLVMLGDAFHDCAAEDRICREDAETLIAIARGRTLIWVVGNHDPKPPESLPGDSAEEVRMGGLLLRHEPAASDAPAGETAGHLHPCARVASRGRSVRRRCFVTDGHRLLLPAFGAYAGGLSVRDWAIASLFRPAPLVAVLGREKVHPVKWSAVTGP